MLKLAVFQGDSKDSWSSAHLFVEQVNKAAKAQIVLKIKYSDLIFRFSEDKTTVNLISTGEPIEKLAEGFYIRDYRGYHPERYAIASYLNYKSKKVFNSDILANEPLSKLEQLVVFAEAGFLIPKSSFTSATSGIESAFHYPYVMKSISSSNNRLNFLVHSDKERKRAIKSINNKILIQEYIENDGDYKTVIMFGEPVATYKRDRSNGYLPGSRGSRVVIDEADVNALAFKVAATLKREFCSIDTVRDKNTGKLYVLESNFNAGLHISGLKPDAELFAITAQLIQRKL